MTVTSRASCNARAEKSGADGPVGGHADLFSRVFDFGAGALLTAMAGSAPRFAVGVVCYTPAWIAMRCSSAACVNAA